MSGVELNLKAARPCFTAKGVWRGAREIVPVAAFVVPYGIAFGVAASAKSMTPEISILISAAVFAGASQFAALDLWYAPLPLTMLALTVLAVNARHLLLGAALAPWLLRVSPLQRLAAVALMSDPNFAYATSARDRGESDAGILFGSGLAMWVAWVGATALGAFAGATLGDVSRFGFDAVMVAYFAAIVVGQWQGRGDIAPWATAAAVAMLAVHLLPQGWHIVAGGLAGGAVGAWRHGR